MVSCPTSPKRGTQPSALETFALAAALGVWLWPGTTVELGLHGDEAFVGLAAHALVQGGPWGTCGMNTHTGPLHQWLVAAAFGVTGPSLYALRAVGVLCNALAAALFARVLTPVLGRAQALWATALLVTLPCIATFSQVAVEHYAVSPLIMVAAVALVQRRPQSPVRQLAAGMLLGLGTWTHLVFLAVPAAWGGVALWHWGRACGRQPAVWRVALGWALVYAAPFVRMSARIKVRHGGLGLLTRLIDTPKLVWLTWQGHYAALRTVGFEPALTANTLARAALVLLAVVGLMLVLRRAQGPWVVVRLGLVALGAMLTTTATIAPFCADRFVLLPLHLLPIFLTVGLFALSRALHRAPFLPHVLCACLMVLQLHYFGRAIAQPWRAGRAVGNTFVLFDMPETNNHYFDVRPAYRALCALNQREVLAQNFIGWALRFYDVQKGRLHVRLTDDGDSFEPRAELRPQDVLVAYAEGFRNDHIDTDSRTEVLQQLQHFSLLRPLVVVPEP